nr:unnamed protein product [Spirometra erinaceieuropaei]
MLYFEDFMEAIESLPAEVNETLTNLRDIDCQTQATLEPVSGLISTLFENCKLSRLSNKEKEIEYERILNTLVGDPRRDLLIVAGGWNGRAGPDDSSNSHLIALFWLGSRCDNAERILNSADQNRLFVTKTCIQHRRKHLLTWYSNNGHTVSHICTRNAALKTP